MNRILLVFFVFASTLIALADNNTTYVYLNNGSVVKGNVTTTATQVTIITDNGQVLTYPMVEVNRISPDEPVQPAITRDRALGDMNDNDTGFWMSAQINGSYSVFLSSRCAPWTEFDVVGGYRFSQYLKVGIGIGGRYYFDNSRLRSKNEEWSFPIFATVRGNFITDAYRDVTPYYSVDLGGAIQDGFMWRPTVGLRIGQSRSAFLVGITYTGQSLKYVTGKDRYVSGLGITLGYEY